MLKSKGIIKVQPTKGRIVVDVSDDLIDLYYYFIRTRYWIRMNRPMHSAHITIFNTKHHAKVNWEKAMWYDGKEVEFDYDEYIVEGGYTKGFLMYYLRVYSDQLDQMKKKLGIRDGEKYRGLHLTISNSKSNSVFPDWPKTIELR